MKCLVLSWGPESSQFSHKIICLVYKPLEHCLSIHFCLSAAPLCHKCLHCGRTYPDLIDPVSGPALLPLCVDFIFTSAKSARAF